jgi:gliding motility-associated-like protein
MLWLGLLACGAVVHAIEPPQLHCLSVEDNGDVTLHWTPAPATADFAYYRVFHSPDGVVFTQLAQLNGNTTNTYTHAGADALNNPRCYYYVSACSATACLPSDTLCTLEFYLTNQANGTAVLNWSPAHTPALPSWDNLYEIQREYPAGTWTSVGHTPQLIHRDTIDICEATLGYRVRLADNSGCTNVSRPLRDIFSDMNAPDIPQLDSVSVNFTTSRIQVGWEQAFSPDVFAYIIYHNENGLWIPVDTIYGIGNTQWTDPVNSSSEVHQYRVAALDSCMNSSAMSGPQHNIRTFVDFDLCRREAYLRWENYEEMPLDVERYLVLYSDNGGPLTLAGETDGQTLAFTIPDLTPQHTYNCVVRAVSFGGIVTATSTKCTFLFNQADNNDFAYIRYVSVVDNRNIEVKVSTGSTVSFSRVHLYRSIGDDQHFTHIASLPNNGTDTYIFLDDNDLRVDRELYYYQASIENECQVETMLSNISHNILITGAHDNEARLNSLTWNDYDGWQGGVQGYQLHRKCEAESDFHILGTFFSGTTEDPVTNLREMGEKFSYFVVGEEFPDEYGFMEESVSNTVVVEQRPLTYIPNAFCPRIGCINQVFKPVHSYVSMSNYHMYIFSREGKQLFHTTDPNEGWDGKLNGTVLPGACYIYRITYTYGTDGEFEAVGTVTLVR